MKYQVIDAGFKLGKEKNVIFATNDKQEAIKAANNWGEGTVVLEAAGHTARAPKVIYISPYKSELGMKE